MHNFRLLALSSFLLIPSTAMADADFALVDADIDDVLEGFEVSPSDLAERESRRSHKADADVDALLGSFDEDPEWDLPADSDEDLSPEDADPSWDVEPDLGELFEEPYAEEDDFIIPQASAPDAAELHVDVEIEVEEESLVINESDEDGIKNANPGLDLSVFDIED